MNREYFRNILHEEKFEKKVTVGEGENKYTYSIYNTLHDGIYRIVGEGWPCSAAYEENKLLDKLVQESSEII